MRAALRPGHSDEEAHFRLAQMYMLRRDYPHAVEVLANARQIFGTTPQVALALGVCYYGLQRYGDAVDEFLKAVALAPDTPQAYVLLGRILEHAGDRLPEVTQRFVELNESNPNNPLGYMLHAKALLARFGGAERAPEAEADQALGLLGKSLALKADGAEARYLMGCVLEGKRQYKASAEELEKSIALNPQGPVAHLRLAEVYEQLGRAEDADRERALHRKLAAAEQAAPDNALGLDLARAGRRRASEALTGG